MTKIVIVGGVAGGASTAARLRRLDEQAEIVLLESGPYISFANCGLPYYIGDTITDRDELLVMTSRGFHRRFCVDVRAENEVTSIDRIAKKVQVLDKTTGAAYEEPYDILVLATGSSPLVPNIDGIDSENIYTLWNMQDTDLLKARIQNEKPKSVAVVGGGFIGLEMVENLRELDIDVTLIEMQMQVMPNVDAEIAAVLHNVLERNGVRLMLGKTVVAFEDTPQGKTLTLDDEQSVDCDMVLLCMGVRPNSALAQQAGLRLNERGGIRTNECLHTSDEDIYAVGDVIEVQHFINGSPVMIPLAGPANKQGRLCADNINGASKPYTGTQGSSVAKVFDFTVASTGLNQNQLEQSGLTLGKDYFTVKTHAWSHATYYPGATQFALKLFYDKDGKILGAQAVGKAGVDKRIDVIAAAIRFGGTVEDLTRLELCYAPPYASAKDPVNMVGFMAENQRNGYVRFIQYDALDHFDPSSATILDVREKSEVEAGCISPSVHIPLGKLRERLHELDKTKPVIVVCAIGLRAYVANRILMQNGFDDVCVLAGGYTTFKQTRNLYR